MKSTFWAFVHNCVAHPCLFWTREARWAVRLHDASAKKAWGDELASATTQISPELEETVEKAYALWLYGPHRVGRPVDHRAFDKAMVTLRDAVRGSIDA
jgi:hypothetical protein